MKQTSSSNGFCLCYAASCNLKFCFETLQGEGKMTNE